MFHQKSTETVTLTRPQLQAILEIISQIGGVSRSDSWNESNSRRYRNDNKLMYTDYTENQSEDRQSFNDNSQWLRHNDSLLTTDWDKDSEHNGRASSLVMVNENPLHNQLLSPTSSNSSKAEEFRTDSVMTNESKESNFRRYVRTNDSEFDWNEYHRKQMKALEYSRALAQQHQENKRKKMDEQQRRMAEELKIDKLIEDQQNQMRKDFERERQEIQEKRLSAEMKREAVIAAIERTPIIKKRNFLVENTTESQPVAAIKPQTRSKEISTQTDKQSSDPNHCDTGTQTDVQLLLHLLKEMNLITKEKSKSEETLSKNSMTASKQKTTNLSKRYKSNINLSEEKVVPKRGVWIKTQNVKPPNGIFKNEGKTSNLKSTQKEVDKEDKKEKTTKTMVKTEDNIGSDKQQNESNEKNFDLFRRQSLDIYSSADNLLDKKKKRVMSSIDLKNKIHFLPQISARPHSRKKWYSQDTFDPKFLS